MPKAQSQSERFQAALDTFITRAKADPWILAVVLCGSLSHDTVWEKSDIDLILIEKDDDKPGHGKASSSRSFALVEDGINIHATLQPRSAFRKSIEGAIQNSFLHSLLSKGKIVYTRDPTLQPLFDDLKSLGSRDQQVQTLRAASMAIPCLYKAQKWLTVKNDPGYAYFWLTMSTLYLAQMQVIQAGGICGREVIQQAIPLNPDFFNAIYTDLLNARKTTRTMTAALDKVDDFLSRRTTVAFGPILDYLRDAGAPRTATELETHFANQLGEGNVVTACEWLSDKDIITKVSAPVRLTRKSPGSFEELAFYYAGAP